MKTPLDTDCTTPEPPTRPTRRMRLLGRVWYVEDEPELFFEECLPGDAEALCAGR